MQRKTKWHLQSCAGLVPYIFLTFFCCGETCVRCVLKNILLCLTVGLCNILLIPVTLNLAKAHRRANQTQTRTKHKRTKDCRTSWQSGGRKLKFTQWLSGSDGDGDEEDVEARGEFYVDDDADVDMQQHVVTQTNIHQYIQIVCIQKHAARHTLPTGCNTQRLHPTVHPPYLDISLTLVPFQ